ncbi:MAG: alpha/beta hydrolase [Bacteroidetes bacterium]|nr:alpha/beta hydrolase [Bacteroidota bacterium]
MIRSYSITGNDITQLTNSSDILDYKILRSISVTNTRDGGNDINIEADDDSIVEIYFDDQTFWTGKTGDLVKLFGQNELGRGEDTSKIEIPISISSGNADRGFLKNIFIKVINFLAPTAEVTDALVKKSAQLVDAHIQPNPGLYYLDQHFNKIAVTSEIPQSDKPYLLFIHGTASSTFGSFQKIMEARQWGMWDQILKTYENRILALEHYTLTQSPFENATDLVKWFPSNINLHIISHSRGGLVGEIIAKYSSLNNAIGFSKEARNKLMKSFPGEVSKFEETIRGKKIKVDKFTRVACPAAGTTLCSSRLDFYINMLINGLNLIPAVAATGVIPILKKLLNDILASKSNPDILPGLYVMNPSSNFLSILNNPLEKIESPLHVIAGNSKFDVSPKGFVTTISKLFYMDKNDWIVDTKSMTCGLVRTNDIGYFYDEGAEVNHFSYFYNKKTQQAMTSVIQSSFGSIASGFEPYRRIKFEEESRGVIMGNLKPKEISGKRPVLLLIPGILGSNLGKDETEIYLQLLKIAMGGMAKLSIDATGVQATSLIGRFYRKFAEHFEAEYDVLIFPYDWRISMDKEADNLNNTIRKILDTAKNQPIRIVAHSMGGLVVRQFIDKYKNDTWAEVTSNNQHKILFLGSPLGGSFLIPEILVGKGKRIRQMASLDMVNDTESLLKIFSEYDGILGLLPITCTAYDFTKKNVWQEMKQKSTAYNWSIPSDRALQNFTNFQKSVLAFDKTVYKNNNFIYIAGKSDSTTNGFRYDTLSGVSDQLKFTTTPYGDGSVTWESGIPEEIKAKGDLYYVMTSHGDLANDPELFDGISEILRSGKTNLLSKNPPVTIVRGITSYDKPEELIEDQTQENLENVMLGATKSAEKNIITEFTSSLTISLKCGDLKYASYPIMVGHSFKC